MDSNICRALQTVSDIYTVLKAQDSTGRIESLIPEKGTLWLWVARLNLFLRYYSLFLNNILVSFVLG